MKPFWIFQKENTGDDREEFQKILSKKHIPFIEIQYFEPMWYQKIPIDSIGIAYGSINFIKQMSRVACYPGYFANFKKLECINYYSYLGDFLVNQEYCYTTYAEFCKKKEMYYEKFAERGLLFVKPNTNDKIFCGELYEFTEDIQNRTVQTLDPTTLILLAKPVNIYDEYRFVAVGDKIITGSIYSDKLTKCSHVNSGPAWDFAQRVLDAYKPEEVFIIDVAYTKDGYKLIELGGFSCAGFYKCDKEIIVDKIQEILNKTKERII